MLDFEILRSKGTTNERLKEIAMAEAPEDLLQLPKEEQERIQKDVRLREALEERIRNRLCEHVERSLRNHAHYSAVDIAWDGPPITKDLMPLMMYAQGKIDLEKCAADLTEISEETVNAYVKKNDAGKPTGINVPEFVEVTINLVRHYITRRHAAQAVKYNNIYPYYHFDPRSTTQEAQLKSDVLNQRVEVMTDQRGYRDHDSQVMRDMMLYAWSMDFVRSSWEAERHWVSGEGGAMEEMVTNEGITFVNPHPSRVFWDNSYPITSLNTDTGCEYVGYWDVKRYRDIHNTDGYYNLDNLAKNSQLWGHYFNYLDYFNQYIETIKPPEAVKRIHTDTAAANDRELQIGTYNGSSDDDSVFITEYFEKIIPNQNGIGDYPYPVWVRYVVAGDERIIYAEILPSSPAAVCAYNLNESRQLNISPAHELMTYQDLMTNLLVHMLKLMGLEQFKVIEINTDLLGNAEDEGSAQQQIDSIRSRLQSKEYFKSPVVIENSFTRLRGMDIQPGSDNRVVTLHETRVSGSISAIFSSMMQLIGLVEKLMAMSPNELGQPSPREISATEVVEIASTTSTIYNFISDSIDSYRAAKKRIIYESLVSMSEAEFALPVVKRYPEEVIRNAGFEIQEGNESDQVKVVLGKRENLIHDYVFTSRDGSERSVNTQSANTLVQLLNVVFSEPTQEVLRAIGKKKLFEIFNQIFRLSGSGLDLNLQLDPSDTGDFGAGQVEQLQGFVQQLAEGVKNNSLNLDKMNEFVARLSEIPGLVQKNAEAIDRMRSELTAEAAEV